MSNYRFIKELIKNAKKVTKDADEATQLKNLAKDYVQTQDDIKYNRDFSNIIRNNNPEEIVVKYPDSDYMYIDNPDLMQILANDAENDAEFLGKYNIRKTKAEINELLDAIRLNKQKQNNARKLQLNEAINNSNIDPLDTPFDIENHEYVYGRNKLFRKNYLSHDKGIFEDSPEVKEYLDTYGDLPF